MKARVYQIMSVVTSFAVLGSAVTLTTLSPAFAMEEPAKPAPAPAKPAPAKPNPKIVVINPATLRSLLVHNNFGVMEQLNLIHQAKDTVDAARGALLPKLNLGAIISGVTAGPAFALSAISFLLPFLLPSNWANLHQSEDLLESQKIGFRLMELNNYGSAYALYETIISDMASREVMVTQYNDLLQVRDYVSSQIGANPVSITQADANVNLAHANVSNIDEALIQERAALGEALALSLTDSKSMVIEPSHVAISTGETIALPALVAKVQALAPENTQMNWMIEAAKQAKWAKVFGFLGGAGLTVGVNNGTPSFSNLTGTGSFSIGFDYVPNINLASDNIENLQIHQRELLAQEQQLVDATQGSLFEALKQLDDTTKAENELISVYQDTFQQYTLGHTDLLHVFTDEESAANATSKKVKALLDIDQRRITLHRELLTDQFASIPGCVIKASAEQTDKNWLGKLFNPNQYKINIDEACAPAN